VQRKLRRFTKQRGGSARLIAFFKLTALPRTDQVAADFAGEPLRAWLTCGPSQAIFVKRTSVAAPRGASVSEFLALECKASPGAMHRMTVPL